MESLQKTCRANGFVFTDAEIEAINNTNFQGFNFLASCIDDRVKRG